jgi:predicted CXXCH cytochrome family protein
MTLASRCLRTSRSLFVLVVLVVSLVVAYLPGQPGPVSAVDGNLPTPTIEPSPADPTPDPQPTVAPSATTEPSPQPSLEPSLEPTAEPSTDPVATPDPSPSASPSASPELPAIPLTIEGFSFARVARPEQVIYLDAAAPLTGESRFEVFRLRFDVINASADDVAWTPLIQFGAAGSVEFADLPPEMAVPGVAFYAAPEWVAAGGGTRIGPAYLAEPADAADPAVARSMGRNPMPVLTIHAGARQTIEFSARATADAPYEATYDFRLTDAGTPLGTITARVEMERKPALELSPGQRSGVPGDAGASAVRLAARFAQATSSGSVHSPVYDLAGDSCAACHRAHAATDSMLTASATELGLCGSCHNGTDLPDIATAFSSVPDNDEATRTYYKHDAADLCTECHNPHDINSVPGSESAAGWTPSGRTYSASGASVSNGAGGPTYQLIARVTLEYQLCFKCHSGANPNLPSNVDQPPSRQLLDKGIEFNPANLSFHPIEAAGTNQSDALNASLSAAGTSPYKLWAFNTTSTIRCVNCHADSRIAAEAVALGQPLLASADLPAHASPQRGILLASYQDRTLNGPIEPYAAADFALCYLCHAEAPFRDTTGNPRADTNYRYHGIHLSNPDVMLDRGFPGTDIDTPGYGSGYAICAECHFRIHSSALPADGKAPGLRLVNFAPNVTAPTGGTLDWQALSEATAGSCTLKCHGAPHNGVQY